MINYTLTATNDGNVTLTGVTITDPTLARWRARDRSRRRWRRASRSSARARYTLTQADLDGGRSTTRRPADSDQTPPTEATETVPLPQAPALTLVKQGTLDTTVVAAERPRRRRRQDRLHADGDQRRQRDADGRDGHRPELATLDCAPAQPATLAPGRRSIVCTGSYTLTQADLDAGQVENTGTADSDQTPPTQAPSTVPLPQAPALALVKQGTLDTTVVAPGNRADAGDMITYTLTATNVGNVTLTGVTISDPKLGTLVCTPAQPATLAPGETLMCTGSYTLTQADINAGQRRQHGDGATATRRRRRIAIETVPLPQVPPLTLVQARHARHDRVAPSDRATWATDHLHADRAQRRQRRPSPASRSATRRWHARLHAGAAGDAGAGRARSPARAATR